MLREAEAADRFRLRHDRLHPRWGNGSLMAAARRYPMADEPGFDDAGYRRCFVMVLRSLGTRWHDKRPVRRGSGPFTPAENRGT